MSGALPFQDQVVKALRSWLLDMQRRHYPVDIRFGNTSQGQIAAHKLMATDGTSRPIASIVVLDTDSGYPQMMVDTPHNAGPFNFQFMGTTYRIGSWNSCDFIIPDASNYRRWFSPSRVPGRLFDGFPELMTAWLDAAAPPAPPRPGQVNPPLPSGQPSSP